MAIESDSIGKTPAVMLIGGFFIGIGALIYALIQGVPWYQSLGFMLLFWLFGIMGAVGTVPARRGQ